MQQRAAGFRTWAIVAVVVLAVGGIAWGVGYMPEHMARERAAKAAAAELAKAQARTGLLEANVWTYRATVALDERNFGLANDAMTSAATALKAIDPATSGVDPAALQAVQTEAGAIRISVASNLEAQRDRVVKLAGRISTLAIPG